MTDVTFLGSTAVGIIVGVVGAYVALRKDSRETRQQAILEAKETIGLLREQTDILKDHGEVRETEWRALEQGWHKREERFEARIGGLERDYRSLVLTVTTMGLCANAPHCPTYNPGDRRGRPQVAALPADETSVG